MNLNQKMSLNLESLKEASLMKARRLMSQNWMMTTKAKWFQKIR